MALGVEYDVPDWSQIYNLLLRQAERIRSSGFSPDIIVGICRGGWVPSRILSDLLDNPNLANVRAESYQGIGKAAQPILTQRVSTNVEGKKVLLVDEVADSGKSLQLIIDHLRDQGASEVKTATLYYKSHCAVKPDFYEIETENWIIFPWETKEALQEIYKTHKGNTSSLSKEIQKLTTAGLSKYLIDLFLKEFSEAKTC